MKIIARNAQKQRFYTFSPCISLSLVDDQEFDIWIEVCKDKDKHETLRQINGTTFLKTCEMLVERQFELEIIE